MQMSSKSEEHANAKRETQSKVKVLVSAKPGMLRDSLFTILSSFDFIEIVGRMTGERIRIEEVLQIQPDVLLIDCFSKTHCTELLNLVHTRPFHMKCIAITDGFQTSKLVMEQGVDAALIKGFTRKDLQSVLSWTVFNNRESKIDLTEGRHRHDQ